MKALIVSVNEKMNEFGAILAVARAEARKREQSKENPPIRALHFVSEVGVYVAIYAAPEKTTENPKSTR